MLWHTLAFQFLSFFYLWKNQPFNLFFSSNGRAIKNNSAHHMTLTFPVPPASLTLIDADGIELEETAGDQDDECEDFIVEIIVIFMVVMIFMEMINMIVFMMMIIFMVMLIMPMLIIMIRMMKTFLENLIFFCRSLSSWCYSSPSVPCVRRFPTFDDHQDDMMIIFKVEARAINHHKPSWFTNDIDMITVIVNLREPSARSDLVERGAISR